MLRRKRPSGKNLEAKWSVVDGITAYGFHHLALKNLALKTRPISKKDAAAAMALLPESAAPATQSVTLIEHAV